MARQRALALGLAGLAILVALVAASLAREPSASHVPAPLRDPAHVPARARPDDPRPEPGAPAPPVSRTALDSAPGVTATERVAGPAESGGEFGIAVHGRVVGEGRAPVTRFGVRALRLDAVGLALETRTWEVDEHEGGEFDLDGLEPGDWRIEPFAPYHWLVETRRVWDTDDRRLDYVLLHWAELRGVVLAPDGSPASGAALVSSTIITTSDAEGRFQTWMPPGRRELHAEMPGFAPSATRTLELELDLDPLELTFVLRPGVRVRGRVLDEFGLGRPGLQVEGSNDADDASVFVRTDDSGEFELLVGAGGDLLLAVRAADGRALFDWCFQARLGDELDVTFAPRVATPVRVRGRIVDAPEGIESVRGTLLAPQMPFAPAAEASVAAGAFEIELPGPGRYRFVGRRRHDVRGLGEIMPRLDVDVPAVDEYEFVWRD